MNEILFFADMHLHERKEFNRMEGELGSRLLEGIHILEQIADVVDKHGIKSVICLGDIFELKDRVPNHIQIAFGEALHAIKAHVYILLGNHDFKIKKYSTLKVMELGDMITLIDRPRMLYIEGQKIGFMNIIQTWILFASINSFLVSAIRRDIRFLGHSIWSFIPNLCICQDIYIYHVEYWKIRYNTLEVHTK
jgi:predicted phosphodiesterase